VTHSVEHVFFLLEYPVDFVITTTIRLGQRVFRESLLDTETNASDPFAWQKFRAAITIMVCQVVAYQDATLKVFGNADETTH
jgi:hypothetical protein